MLNESIITNNENISAAKNLLSRVNNVPSFPLESFPSEMQQFIYESAESICCPIDFIAVPLMVMTGGLIGSTHSLRLKNNWIEIPNLYAGIIGNPAARKSPALNQCTKFISQLVPVEEMQDNNRLYSTDSTIEALIEIIVNNPYGIILIRDELTGLIRSLNQYKGGKGSDREFLLSCWSGAPIIYDRKSKPFIAAEKGILSVVGCIAPEMLTELRDPKNRDDGLIDRFIFAFPEQKHQEWSYLEVSEKSIQNINNLYIALHQYRIDSMEVIVDFEPEAHQHYVSWYNYHNDQINSKKIPTILNGIWGKMPSQAARIALILHICSQFYEGNTGQNMNKSTVTKAIAIAEYFKQHAKKTFCYMQIDDQTKKVVQILDWAKRKEKNSFKKRDIQHNHVAGLNYSKQIDEILNFMEELGLGYWDPDDKGVFILYENQRDNATDEEEAFEEFDIFG